MEEQLRMILSKVNENVGLIYKLCDVLPRSALVTTSKAFIRCHLNSENIIYNQAYNATLTDTI